MKRHIALILLLAMAIAVCSCGNTDMERPEDTTESGVTTAQGNRSGFL